MEKPLSPDEGITEGGIGMKCPSCGAENTDEAIFCSSCSKRLMIAAGKDVEVIDQRIAERSEGLVGVTISRRTWKSWATFSFVSCGALSILFFAIGFWPVALFSIFIGISGPIVWYFFYVPVNKLDD